MLEFLKKLRNKNAAAHMEAAVLCDEQGGGRLSSDKIKAIFDRCDDFQYAELALGGADGRVRAILFYIDGIVDGKAVGRDVIRPLTNSARFREADSETEAMKLLSQGIVFNYSSKKRERLDDVANDILMGWCALVFDGIGQAYCFETKTSSKRGVEKPENEKAVKGSKDSFTETYRVNTALIRSKLRTSELKIEEKTIGRRSHTRVGLAYIDGLTSGDYIRQAKKRLDAMDIDALLTAGGIQEYMLNTTSTVFPQMLSTERPDKFCINLLEGRVGLIVDGLPLVFLLPATFSEFLKVPEDNAEHFIVASGITFLRYIAMIISVLLPAMYVAIAMYHHEMIPIKLMLSIIQSKQDVPFSTVTEVLGMLIAFELLQEAGLRLPQSIGETVSIIGALIVGQSAVEAKVLSPVVVIVVALAGIAGYTMPNQDMASALRMCRFVLTVLSLAMGLFGIVMGSIVLIYHLCTLENFDTPYMAPFCEGDIKGVFQAILRLPLKNVKFSRRYMKAANMKSRAK